MLRLAEARERSRLEKVLRLAEARERSRLERMKLIEA
jgi:hypothetical protein